MALHVDATAGGATARFDVAPRDVLALTGPPAAGTAMIRAIAGRIPVTAGRIAVDGVIVSEPGRTVPRDQRRVGAVFAGYRLTSKLTVRDHVANVFRRRGAALAVAREAAQPWLERFELDHPANLRPGDLEPAQRLSLALARALSADPAVLVLDDPLGPLTDPALARTTLRRLLADFGRPVVVATTEPDSLATERLVLTGSS